MSHEPGRERHMQRTCEKCGGQGPLSLHESHDEYWCESCFDNEAEAAYDRHQEWLMETGGGPIGRTAGRRSDWGNGR